MDAQHELSGRYGTGIGTPQDDFLAAEWLKKAAEQGHAEAQSDLGLYYDTGRGVERNFVEASAVPR